MSDEIFKLLELHLESLDSEEKINEEINKFKKILHRYSPFNKEPVDCVLWVPENSILANDYNPNVMAPVEKKLLQHSLKTDGFTQPIVVTQHNDQFRVVDGYHRYLTGKGLKRIKGYLPVTVISHDIRSQADYMAVTVRHNRARGKHQITAMSDIVRDLSRLGWDDARIGVELGMDTDEILRLKQISGLAELFEGNFFSDAWTVK